MTFPAAKYLKDDPWFGPATLSETQESFKQQYDLCVAERLLLVEEETGAPNNIHEILYQIATSTGKTTTQLDPQVWMSGSGINQFA